MQVLVCISSVYKKRVWRGPLRKEYRATHFGAVPAYLVYSGTGERDFADLGRWRSASVPWHGREIAYKRAF